MKALVALAIAAAISGCAGATRFNDPVAGQYTDYRQMALFRVISVDQRTGVPSVLKAQYYGCMVDTTLGYVTPAELDHLNAYARAQTKVTPAEQDTFDDMMRQRIGDKEGLLAAMQKRCPDAVSKMAKYGL